MREMGSKGETVLVLAKEVFALHARLGEEAIEAMVFALTALGAAREASVCAQRLLMEQRRLTRQVLETFAMPPFEGAQTEVSE